MNNKFKELRRKSSLTQQQVANVLGIDRSTYSYYESGKITPSLAVLKRIAKVFNVSLDYVSEGLDMSETRESEHRVMEYDFSAENPNTIYMASDVSLPYEGAKETSQLTPDQKTLMMYSRLLDKESLDKLIEYADELVKSKE